MGAFFRRHVVFTLMLIASLASSVPSMGEDSALQLHLRSRTDSEVRERTEAWEAKKTALIICDMWDAHWCKSAARRVAEMAGPLNEAVRSARAKGVFIIHAPSTCMEFYKDTHSENAPWRRHIRQRQYRW